MNLYVMILGNIGIIHRNLFGGTLFLQPTHQRVFLGRGKSLAIFWGHVYWRNGEVFLGLGIVEGGGNNQPIEGRTKTMPLVHNVNGRCTTRSF
jgi:hypothetical protein